MYDTVNIIDLIKLVGEDEVKSILSDFSCEKNPEIEGFVRKNAIEFSKKKMSVTYLIFDRQGRLTAIFALTHKAIQIENEGISNSVRKKIKKYAQLDESTDTYAVSAFLVAQLGKNSNYTGGRIEGDDLLEIAEEVLTHVQK